jgi:hypothetical protein
MFQTEPLLAAIQADRRRQIAENGRSRRLLEPVTEARSDEPRAVVGGRMLRVDRMPAIGSGRTGSNGGACEAL